MRRHPSSRDAIASPGSIEFGTVAGLTLSISNRLGGVRAGRGSGTSVDRPSVAGFAALPTRVQSAPRHPHPRA